MEKSKGHLMFSECGFEYFDIDGQVYRSDIRLTDNYIDVYGYRSARRWVCSITRFNHYKEVFNVKEMDYEDQ